MMPTLGVFASIFDEQRRILLVRQTYAGCRWTTPGGRVEPGESPLAALHREVREEISCAIEVLSLTGVYSKPYKNDVVLSFLTSIISGLPCPKVDEISEVGFFSRSELPPDMAENTRVRLIDAFEKRSFVRRFFVDAQAGGSSCVAFAP
jgi:8-oxo-dGTP diphosphatase